MSVEPEIIKNFLLYFVSLFFRFLELGLIIHILLSWLARGRSPLGVAVDRVIRPLLKPFEFATFSGLSFAPIVLLLVMYFVQDMLFRIINAAF